MTMPHLLFAQKPRNSIDYGQRAATRKSYSHCHWFEQGHVRAVHFVQSSWKQAYCSIRGKAIAIRLAHDGYDVCINDIPANHTGIDSVYLLACRSS